MRVTRKYIAVLSAVVLAGACSGDGGVGPGSEEFVVAAQSTGTRFGTRGELLSEPLEVIVTDPATNKARADVEVTWRVISGSATVVAASDMTDRNGVSSMTVRLGADTGTSVIEASVMKLRGSPARFTVRVVDPPSITGIMPASAVAGDTITIDGRNFSSVADENVLLFGGFRGRVVAASITQLRVVVPLCVPSRVITLQALLGTVAGNSMTMTVSGVTTPTLDIARGEAITLTGPAEMGCFRLPGGIANMSMLIVPQNFAEIAASSTAVELAGLTGSGAASAFVEKQLLPARTDPVDSWERNLRMREREMLKGPMPAEHGDNFTSSASMACTRAANIGDRCTFQVFNKNNQYTSVNAEIKAIGTHTILYQDLATAASGALTTAQFNALVAAMDDPIYPTDVATWGSPSDKDGNGKVIILMTPVVNALTPKNSNGYIAGFFYGCDLLGRTVCSGSNEAEIFYTFTTDPTGQYSDVRTADAVMRSLPPVLAHEFQHMINFGERGQSTDALWLSEGMAHHAEDILADVYEQRGDPATAAQFRAQNYLRANRYLRATSSFSLVSQDDASSLELRGAAWLFVKYLAGQYGNGILMKLSKSIKTGVDNVVTQTGKSWSSLTRDWGIALWADDAPQLTGVTLKTEFTFPNINLRQRLGNSDGSYPLRPSVYGFEDFMERETLRASSQAYVMLNAGASAPAQLSLTFGGAQGGPFSANAAPQLTVFRIN